MHTKGDPTREQNGAEVPLSQGPTKGVVAAVLDGWIF